MNIGGLYVFPLLKSNFSCRLVLRIAIQSQIRGSVRCYRNAIEFLTAELTFETNLMQQL